MERNTPSLRLKGNIEGGVIRKMDINLDQLTHDLIANELFECFVHGKQGRGSPRFEPNLISCRVEDAEFTSDFQEIDAKDVFFHSVSFHASFENNLITLCTLKKAMFINGVFNNTVFVDSHLEDVSFFNCDLSGATFKGNQLKNCRFYRCVTSNKLFEHCSLLYCRFNNMKLLETTVMQNFGIRARGMKDVNIVRPQTREVLEFDELKPSTSLERISYDLFLDKDINESIDLLNAVNLKFSEVDEDNILHILSGLRHLTSFLAMEYEGGRLLTFFPIRLFWSIEVMLDDVSSKNFPSTVVESLEFCSGKLRRIYEHILFATHGLLSARDHPLECAIVTSDGWSETDIERLLEDLSLGVRLKYFRMLNSPGLAVFTATDPIELIMFLTLVLSAKYKLEIEKYRPGKSPLLLASGVTPESKSNALAYSTLILINIPRIMSLKLSVNVNLSILRTLRRMFLAIVQGEGIDKADELPLRNDELFRDIELVDGTATELTNNYPRRKKKILFLGANSSSAHLDLEREVAKIVDSLKRAKEREWLDFRQVWAVTADALVQAILDESPNIVHFSGHSQRDGILLLGDAGEESFVSGNALSQLFKLFEFIDCVMLISCYSADQAAAINRHIPYVIGVRTAIDDESAAAFSAGFYKGIGAGKDIPFAFNIALATMRMKNLADDMFVLLRQA